MQLLMCRRSALFVAVGAFAAALAGCGGGSGSGSGSQVTRATRDRVHLVQTQNIRLLARNGGQTLSIASARNGAFVNGASAANSVGGGGASAAEASTNRPIPMVGSFIQNVAASRPNRSAASRRARTRADTGDPNFYFDDFLGLWVQFTDTTTQTIYLLFMDQAKTQPAGSIVTTFPAADADPQVFSSDYTFTAGLLAGSHGSYKTTISSDGSGSSSYDDSSPDGWSGSGESTWRANGDYTWSSRTTIPGGISSNDRGTFHADGSGFTHSDASDGFVSDFTYRADGSGFGKVSGPAAGLPASIAWDAMGNTTITYADGTVDHFNAWFIGPSDGGVAVSGSSGSGTANGSANTTK